MRSDPGPWGTVTTSSTASLPGALTPSIGIGANNRGHLNRAQSQFGDRERYNCKLLQLKLPEGGGDVWTVEGAALGQ